jgi:hypothetical protein
VVITYSLALYPKSGETERTVPTEKLVEPLQSLATPGTTFCSAAFASAALLRLAHSCGLDWNSYCNNRQSIIAGKVADIATLTVARELGFAFTISVLCGAAESGCIVKLSWLYTECNLNQWHTQPSVEA